MSQERQKVNDMHHRDELEGLHCGETAVDGTKVLLLAGMGPCRILAWYGIFEAVLSASRCSLELFSAFFVIRTQSIYGMITILHSHYDMICISLVLYTTFVQKFWRENDITKLE